MLKHLFTEIHRHNLHWPLSWNQWQCRGGCLLLVCWVAVFSCGPLEVFFLDLWSSSLKYLRYCSVTVCIYSRRCRHTSILTIWQEINDNHQHWSLHEQLQSINTNAAQTDLLPKATSTLLRFRFYTFFSPSTLPRLKTHITWPCVVMWPACRYKQEADCLLCSWLVAENIRKQKNNGKK